jgi:hypothetical protein
LGRRGELHRTALDCTALPVRRVGRCPGDSPPCTRRQRSGDIGDNGTRPRRRTEQVHGGSGKRGAGRGLIDGVSTRRRRASFPAARVDAEWSPQRQVCVRRRLRGWLPRCLRRGLRPCPGWCDTSTPRRHRIFHVTPVLAGTSAEGLGQPTPSLRWHRSFTRPHCWAQTQRCQTCG